MTRAARSSGDTALTSGNSSDVANLPDNDRLHEEYIRIGQQNEKRLEADSAQASTTGDTTVEASDPATTEVRPHEDMVRPDGSKADADPVPPNVEVQEQFHINPEFKDLSTENIHAALKKITWAGRNEAQHQLLSDAFQEVIGRYDHQLKPPDAKESVASIGIIQNALEAGKLVRLDDNKNVVMTDQELTSDERLNYHKAVAGDLSIMGDQIAIRQEYALFLRAIGKTTESEKMSREAIELSERVPADLVQRQAKSAEEFGKTLEGTEMGEEFKRYVNWLTNPENGYDKLPFVTRKQALANSLGLNLEETRNFIGVRTGGVDVTFGTEKLFDSDRAFELATELRQKTIELTGKDPLKTGDKANGAFYPAVIDLGAIDFSKNNVYAMAEQLSGRRFEDTGKIGSEEFADISAGLFDRIDSNGDKRLDANELTAAAADKTLTNKEKQAVDTLRETQSLLQGLDITNKPREGISREDLHAFAREQRESTERLEKIKDARARLLFNNEFDTADGNSNQYLTQRELRNFLTAKANGSPLSESELKSFNYLNENFSKLSKSWWGMTRSDLVDTRPESVQRVESSLWKAYYNSRPVSDK